MKICLIGNNGFGKPVFDGQRIKVRTYKNVLESEGFDVHFIELDKPAKRLFKILSEIKKGIKECDVIVLITSDNGERILIPFINRLNRKYKKRFIFSQIGTSFLFPYIKSLNEEQKYTFFHKHVFLNLKPKKKVVRNLRSIDAILTETELINDAFSKFFSLENCFFMTNFRFVEQPKDNHRELENRLVYLSRVTARKGIFDLLNVLKEIKEETNKNFFLDIYGTLYLNDKEKEEFYSLLNNQIVYKGELPQSKIISVLQQCDLMCFPTRCEGEGTPGCVIESLIAGTPVLSSSFTQSYELLSNNYNSIIYNFGDVDDLKEKLLSFFDNYINYQSLKDGALKTGYKYTYEYNRDRFLKIICGGSYEK